MADSTPVPTADQQVLITRIFEATRERVFRAWTDPDEVAAWYGPADFDAPRERINIDLRVGGRWELTMVRKGGAGEFAIGYDILELVEPELIVLARTSCRRSACTSPRSSGWSSTTTARRRA